MIRRSRVVIVICPSLQETVREIDPGARCLIENAPGSSDEPATAEQAAAVRRGFGLLARARRWCCTPGRSRPIRDWICCLPPWPRAHADPEREAVAGRRQARSGGEGQGAGARGGNRRGDDLRGRAPVDRDSGVPACVRRARVAAVARDQYAVEDLSVSALGKADCRHAAADPYAGLERRHRDSDRRHARCVRRGHRGGAAGPGAGGARRGAGARTGRDEVQLRGVSRTDAAGLCGALPRPFRHRWPESASPARVRKDVA